MLYSSLLGDILNISEAQAHSPGFLYSHSGGCNILHISPHLTYGAEDVQFSWYLKGLKAAVENGRKRELKQELKQRR